MERARKLACRLRDDGDFYNECREEAIKSYFKLYTEDVFVENMKKKLSHIYG